MHIYLQKIKYSGEICFKSKVRGAYLETRGEIFVRETTLNIQVDFYEFCYPAKKLSARLDIDTYSNSFSQKLACQSVGDMK